MSQPARYKRNYDFTSYQTRHTSTPLPAFKLDAELDAVAGVLDEVLLRIKDLQRDDRELANKLVGYDQLKDELRNGFSTPTVWAASKQYALGASVYVGRKVYSALSAHTSAGDFNTDLVGGKWYLLADFTAVTQVDQSAIDAAAAAAQSATDAADAALGIGAALTDAQTAAQAAELSAANASGFADASSASAAAAAQSVVDADAVLTSAVRKENNLSDIPDKEAARTTLGLGSAATKNDGAGGGLDADTLDGAHGSAYAKLSANNTFTGVQAINGGLYTYGHGGDNNKGIVRYNSTGTVYTMFDGSKFLFTNGLSITGGIDTSSGISVGAGSVGLAADAWFYSYNGGTPGNVRAGIKCVGSDTGTLEFWAGSSKKGFVRFDGVTGFPGTYALTTGSSANVNVDAAGVLARSTSSLRYKKDVVTYDLGIEKLKKLRPVTYRSKATRDGDGLYAGFIAEEVDAAGLTEFVVYNEAGEADALQYGSFTALLAKALQEAVDNIEALEARLAVLEAG
jgi:hypothetical protein